jgi:hypothetical protein
MANAENDEDRMRNDEGSTNVGMTNEAFTRKTGFFRHLDFVIPSCFVIRISSFTFRPLFFSSSLINFIRR